MKPWTALLILAAVADQAAFTPYDEARPLVATLRESLPTGLAGLDAPRLAAAWPQWVRARDRAVRARLGRGEQDTVANLLYFGTSFTAAPRLPAEAPALLKPGGDERLALARSALGVSAARPAASAGERRRAVELPVLQAVARVQK